MMKAEAIEPDMRRAVFPLLALMFSFQAYACRGIYADGANFFLQSLMQQDLPWFDWQRMVNHIIIEGPTIVLLRCGVHGLFFLRYFFSTWVLFVPLFVWASALWAMRREILFWPFAMLFCIAYFGVNFFAIGEYNLCFALAGYCLAGFLTTVPRVSMIAAAASMSFNYPSALFLGALLCVAAVMRKDWLLAALFAIAAATGLWEVLMPRDPVVLMKAKNTYNLRANTQFWCVMVYAALAMLMCFLRRPKWKALSIVLCAVLLGVMICDPSRLYPAMQHGVRAYVAAEFTFFAGVVWLMQGRVKRTHFVTALAVFCLVAQLAMFDALSSLAYARYVSAFREAVNNRTGFVEYKQSGLPFVEGNERFYWIWAHPLMSLILRDGSDKAIILNPSKYQGYEPFDAHKNLPDLERYYR